jgi:hypothetical protein
VVRWALPGIVQSTLHQPFSWMNESLKAVSGDPQALLAAAPQYLAIASAVTDLADEQRRDRDSLAPVWSGDAFEGLQSLNAYWAGRPQEAVRYAKSGAEYATNVTGSVAAWLPALEARAWALMNMDGEAREAIGRTVDLRSSHNPDDLDAIGGLLAFTEAKQSYYTAGTYVYFEDEDDQERAQSEALRLSG